ncbi:abortive infection phage resistance protein abiU [Richelia sinica FACHB-800]|uniref:Abortive infection phage resistance protein abiU n=1 Tax=Richelia sinica FACHB-800 TaxID=1357546 RepID=A0A975TCU3_9NOST|nr:AIPR family protein [Richelia sinica]MBD2663929.1 AIPR family protein [Richelia sinica FACHB-800]QXE26344.1 abortive infection phage resistance protein abiU [Richelia sinica FACHB-800]
MAVNDILFLENTLEQKKNLTATSLSKSDFFELFTFEQILKKFDLSNDELLSGKTGKGDDGGIDGFFVFIENRIIDDFMVLDNNEKATIKISQRNPSIELYLIQAKETPSFSEQVFDKVISTIMTIFDFRKEISELSKNYNQELIKNLDKFRQAIKQAVHANLSVNFFYASTGDRNEIHPKVFSKADLFKQTISQYLPGSRVSVEYWGARELLEQSRQEVTYTLNLNFLKNISSHGQYVLLSSLKDYYNFVTDEHGNLRRYIFESNVRDYQGDVGVNQNIRNTLERENDIADFWWLNNGVTILASKESISGDTIQLDDVQIVNGLQTTTEVYKYVRKQDKTKNIDKAILIKVIVIQDPETRDRIIKATNYQTPIPTTQISIVTQSIQRDIEHYFLNHNWFYDRRKNYYKNIGKPIDRIISITYLAQAVMAIVLFEPHKSSTKGSPSLIITKDYERVFNQRFQPDVYLFCASTLKNIETFIRNNESEQSNVLKDIDRREIQTICTPENLYTLRFHIAMLLTSKLAGKSNYKPDDIKSLVLEELSKDILKQTISLLINFTISYARKYKYSLHDVKSIVKDKNFTQYLQKQLIS